MYQILIVDDEERYRRTYRNLLERKGFQTATASNASDAKEIIVKKNVDLILLDIKMGEVNGDIFFEVARAFHPNIKIIVSSVYPLEEQYELINGADDYYDKSESLNVLLKMINKIVSRKSIDSHKKTILVIDDDQKVRVIYHELLSNAGYDPLEVSDSDGVLDFLKKQINNIDLIILDLMMPKISGIDLFDVIKEKYPNTKVIISSNYAVDEQEALMFTADDYYDKSESSSVLLRKVENLFREKKLLNKIENK